MKTLKLTLISLLALAGSTMAIMPAQAGHICFTRCAPDGTNCVLICP